MPNIQKDSPALHALMTRMHSYDGNFDGYPSWSEADAVLVYNAIKEHVGQCKRTPAEELADDPYSLDTTQIFQWCVFYAESADQIRRSFDFMRDHMMSVCACVMIESAEDEKVAIWDEFIDQQPA
jgi:hypothetical protein